ncbi:MAG: hypothetical protein WC742_02810 [Gallionellaceae bacterium]|jgi:hypothetical protein
MNFTDFTGTTGIASAVTLLILQLREFAGMRRNYKLGLAAALTILLLIPFGGLSLAEILRGLLGDLSITSLLMLVLALRINTDVLQQRNLKIFIALMALVLFPFALGVGMFDPYRLGFGNPGFIAALLLISLGTYYLRQTYIALSITLAALAWSVGWGEANNLWNYLIDPWLGIYALGSVLFILGKAVVRRFFPS